jgi:hypothetical protein
MAKTKQVSGTKRSAPGAGSKKSNKKAAVNDVSVERVRNEALAALRNKANGGRAQRSGAQSSLPVENVECIDYLISSTKAVIELNQEIWERCVGSIECKPGKGGLRFQRTAFAVINVASESQASVKQTKFTTTAESQTKAFGTLPSLPSVLTDYVVYKPDTDVAFPDYIKLLKSSLLLREDVLPTFLAKLKQHLEDVQVFLGGIDSWLMDPQGCIDFMQEHFGMTPAILQQKTYCSSYLCKVTHDALSICKTCNRAYNTHRHQRYAHAEVYTHYCLGTGNPFGGSFELAAPPTVLKTINLPSDHSATFKIDQPDQQRKLLKFIEYVEA